MDNPRPPISTIQQKLSTFLLQYQKAPNVTTTPAMLFLKRDIRNGIDLLLQQIFRRKWMLEIVFSAANTNTWYHCKPGWSTSLHRRCLRNLEITTSRGSKKQPKYSACRNSGRSEQGIGFVPEVPSTDVVVPDVSPSSAKVTETRSPPIPRRPFPRRSGRQPPKRLGL
ncbi:hypothetical protein TNCV_821171 [Trichonephila clavipes]|nr:hypothetical protein TNCV_821171 [Trichonephila clavipes]